RDFVAGEGSGGTHAGRGVEQSVPTVDEPVRILIRHLACEAIFAERLLPFTEIGNGVAKAVSRLLVEGRPRWPGVEIGAIDGPADHADARAGLPDSGGEIAANILQKVIREAIDE